MSSPVNRPAGNLFDKSLLFLTVIFFILGIISVADTSAPLALTHFSDSFYFVKQQTVWTALAVGVLFVSMNIHFSFWKKLAYPLFGISLVLLIIVLIPGISSKIYGARRWIDLGIFSVQPSEVVKITLILLIAKFADEKRNIWYYLIPLGLVSGLVMLEPDLGTTLVIISVGFIQMFVAGVSVFNFLAILVGGGILGGLAILISDYRRQRLMTFFNSANDPLGSSYHIRQILLAIGSGGIFGVGLGQSRQKYLFLPEVATDSVFAILAEELGFVGSIVIIGLLTFLIYRLIKIASRAPDTFSVILATGISAWIGVQSVLNLAAMTALVPLTGIPLPFFSYGGSHLTMIAFGIGILLNISRYSATGAHIYAKRK